MKMCWHSRDGASAAVFRHWKEEMRRNSRWMELLAFLGRCRENKLNRIFFFFFGHVLFLSFLIFGLPDFLSASAVRHGCLGFSAGFSTPCDKPFMDRC